MNGQAGGHAGEQACGRTGRGRARCEWVLREQGSRDHRLLPPTVCGWAASLAMHECAERCLNHDGVIGMLPLVLVLAAPLLAACAGVSSLLPARFRVIALRWHWMMIVCAAAAIACATCALTYDLLQWRDAAFRLASQNQRQAIVRVTASTPAINADRRAADCRIDAVATALSADGVTQPSAARMRVYADGDDCAALKQGGEYLIDGTIQESEYGAMPLWLTDVTRVERVRAPNLLYRAVDAMQQAFLSQTMRLSDQGKVLVPGLTLGILGQDHMPTGKDVTAIDAVYADRVEDAFRRSGILHLMAVSGGHLAVVAALTRSCCAMLLLPRQVVAASVAMAYTLLAACMYPSDSVSRALMMGYAGAIGLLIGRRTQALATLSWTTLLMLLIRPHMARSFGFALSCAAVLGIVLFAQKLNDRLAPIMPLPIAQAASMTIAAQVLTLPIQVLIEPEIPMFSILANIVVTPFVGFSTLAGLASLATSWLCPQLGLSLAQLASMGTAVMELASRYLGSGEHAVLAWPNGLRGALAICLMEAACALAVWLSRLLLRKTLTQHEHMPGQRFLGSPAEPIRMWWERTLTALHDMQWKT